jgi:hypothetical protein
MDIALLLEQCNGTCKGKKQNLNRSKQYKNEKDIGCNKDMKYVQDTLLLLV